MSYADSEPATGAVDEKVIRARRLFEFLAHAQQLKYPPTRSVYNYDSVFWLAGLPRHPAVVAHRRGTSSPAEHERLLTIERVPRVEPPTPDDVLRAWMIGPLDDHAHPPELRDSLGDPADSEHARIDSEDGRPPHLDSRPDIRDAYAEWLGRWRAWAAQEAVDGPVRRAYADIFSLYEESTGKPEDLELVVAVGCLAWTPPADHVPVKRHLLTAPAAVQFDDSGRLTVELAESPDAFNIELDMLDPGLTRAAHLDDVRADARVTEAHPLDRDVIGALLRRIVVALDSEGEYQDTDVAAAPTPRAITAFAPAIILRKRSQIGLVEVLRTIADQLGRFGPVPAGILPLIDPDYRPPVETNRADGAVVLVDDDVFLPLPVNDVQLRILRHADANAQTLVQGPPGTGKTHTAAALLSHLLAQGKRVLVTAHSDRALKEIRDRLPEAIRPLSVAVVGASRQQLADLRMSAERIIDEAGVYDSEEAEARIRMCLESIDRDRGDRAALYRQLIEGRADEEHAFEHAGYRGTRAAIALQRASEADRFGWLEDFVRIEPDIDPPLDNDEMAEWYGCLINTTLQADESEPPRQLTELSSIPEPSAFAHIAAVERTELNAQKHSMELNDHPAFAAVGRLDSGIRQEMQRRLRHLADFLDELHRRTEPWIADAVRDIQSGRTGIWQARERQISDLLGRCAAALAGVDPVVDIQASDDLGRLSAWAISMRDYLARGGKLKIDRGGTPRLGKFAPAAAKQAQPLFERVRLNGVPPTTIDQLTMFLAWAGASMIVDALDHAWPASMAIPPEDTLYERLNWHATESEQLRRVLQLGAALDAEERGLTQLGLPVPDWTDTAALRAYAELADAVPTRGALGAASRPLRELEAALVGLTGPSDSDPSRVELIRAVRERDDAAYAGAYRRWVRLDEVRGASSRRDALGTRLAAVAPTLRSAVERDPADKRWGDRLSSFAEAWIWAETGAWLRAGSNAEVNMLQAEVTRTEHRIRREVETLAAIRAWSHAVSPTRLSGRARADLTDCIELVRRLAIGEGKHVTKRQSDISHTLDLCRTSVPVWIMPIHRIAEHFTIEPNMFDVIVVDEASRAGSESTFLQYLAPKIVVIGDDKQGSPAAVGVDQQQLNDLAGRYLADDPHRAYWADPHHSLFDEAKMRYGGMLTLTEHWRCVPEIIGFSNRIAYEPDGVRLISVRQYGADRLEPIKSVHVGDGYTRGTTIRINPPEVDAIVNEIVQCLADPRYDGFTFGVISLLGGAQAKAIEDALLDRVPSREWKARDLRCGDSADFQSSERDVMFLSMVAAPEPGTRPDTLTRDLDVQRYNVAGSCAKNQMWVFHSIRLVDLGDPDDMRFQLLDYCDEVRQRDRVIGDGQAVTRVLEDSLVEPFDSRAAEPTTTPFDESSETAPTAGTQSAPAVEHRLLLEPYETLTETLPPPVTVAPSQLVDGILRVVAVEGPVVGRRLHLAYVRAAGGRRTSPVIVGALDAAIHIAIWQGSLVEENPLDEVGSKARTYRLPYQPQVRQRQLGPRSFDEIPPRELAALVAYIAREHGWDDEETLFRATLDLLGLRRLTANVRERFTEVLPLARVEASPPPDGLSAPVSPVPAAAADEAEAEAVPRPPTAVSAPVSPVPAAAVDETEAEAEAVEDEQEICPDCGEYTVNCWCERGVPDPEPPYISPIGAAQMPNATAGQFVPRSPTGVSAPVSPVPAATANEAEAMPPILPFVASLLRSTTLTAQQELFGHPLSGSTVGAAVTALLRSDRVLPLDSLAGLAGESEAQAAVFAATLQRLLNVEENQVVSIVDDGCRVRLDLVLLREQFRI